MYWSIMALWVFVLLQFIVIFMLTKLVAQFLNKLQLKEANDIRRELQAGDMAPLLTYNSGNEETAEFPRKENTPTLALFTADGCPFCKKVLAELTGMRERYPWMRIVVFTTVDEKEPDIHPSDMIEYIQSTEAFTLYEIKGVPAAMLIDAQGVIAIKAAIANYKHLQKLLDEYFTGERSRNNNVMHQKTFDMNV
ncbi:thioredoxin fold domain-containing protein [Paenibacillus elgii]|uniref:thioredoxin fold domain-containing protein n=1 Tax=Paenibacillus elgii TaxID=189691 RepID=UPI001300C4F3|nr:thioredoxin fold domain-containing protein [Paenibacillus elgii]